MKDDKLLESLRKYRDHFGECYRGIGFFINKPEDEIIKDIEECIKTNTPQEKIEFDKDSIY